jgi:acyl-CoA thioester hydrolase
MAQTYTTGIEVRFSDLDAYGHVNSAVYFTYLETARVKLFREQFEALMRQGIFLLVVRAECDFKIPIMLGDEVVVTLWLAKAGRASFELEYRLHDGKETTYATARTTMVSFDSASKSTMPLPEIIRAMA